MSRSGPRSGGASPSRVSPSRVSPSGAFPGRVSPSGAFPGRASPGRVSPSGAFPGRASTFRTPVTGFAVVPLGPLVLLLFLLPALACDATAGPQAVEIESGGLALQGRLFHTPAGGRRPIVLMVPGWPGNPEDVLGMGKWLSQLGVNVLVVFPRGMHGSQGTLTYEGAFEDIGAALAWLRRPENQERFRLDPEGVFLGGYSWGGGLALSYAAWHPGVQRVIAIAATDQAELIRGMEGDNAYASQLSARLRRARFPGGPIRFEPEEVLRELSEDRDVYGLRENAGQLATRSILLLGGVDDESVTLEDHLLPFYRALKSAGAEDVTIEIYQDDHDFQRVREEMAEDMAAWIRGHVE